MKALFIFIAALIALVSCQDSYGLPDKLLADVNPGPNSSYPGVWYTIQSAGKAYTTVTISGKVFKQIVVTDGTTAGTKLLSEINFSNRGNPYTKDPFWNPEYDYMIQFFVFDEILWLSMYNYDTSSRDIWTIDPADDVLKKYTGGIVSSVDEDSTDYLNIQKVGIFKGEYFAFSNDVVDHGLQFFDKTFSTFRAFNNASDFNITADPYDPFTGFEANAKAYLVTKEFLIIAGWVQNYGGLWAYDGTTVWPLNLGTAKFHDSLKVYDSVNKKLYYIAFFNELPQLVVNDLNDLSSNFTILTNLDQECFPVYNCFSYLGVMDEQKGTIAFAYNTQLGFTNGTLAGTTFMTATPRAYDVLGAYNRKLYFRDYVDIGKAGSMMVTDGTQVGTKVALDQQVTSPFVYFNGNVFFETVVQFWRIDKDDEFTLIRESGFSYEWTRVTLSNNHKQLYLAFASTENCGRGCTRKHFWIHVTDGNGMVRFSDDFKVGYVQPVFLNDKFIMSASSPSTGTEIYYMDAAPESYETPPPEPFSPGSVPRTSNAVRFALVALDLTLMTCIFLALQ